MIVKIDKDNKGIYLCPIDCTELIDDKCPECGFDNNMWGANDRTKMWDKDEESE